LKKKKVRFIVNPKSGGNFRTRLTEGMVRRHLDLSRFTYDIYKTRYAGHAIKLAQQCLIEEIDIVAVVGGDGTQNEVGQILMNTEVVLANIPTGSGNAIARKLHIPLYIPEAIQLINTGKVFAIDAVILNGQPFFMAAGLGYDGKVIQQFDKIPFRGVASYLTSILSTAFTYKLPTFTIHLDNKKPFSTQAFTVLITNTGQVGYNIEFCHESVINDGIFEITIVKNFNRLELPMMIREAFYGDIAKQPFLESHHCRKLKITTDSVEALQMDGDYKGSTNCITASVKRQVLKYIVPQEYEP
jgi:YegS/Rv2252/BmrU family lipid kinase